jgi:hypothetical protein
MKKGTVIAFLILIPVIGVSSTNLGKQKPAKSSSNRPVPIAALFSPPAAYQGSVVVKKDDAQDSHRVVMILQTRYYMLTIYGGEDHLYSVSTQDGVALAEKLSPGELKVRFPELHDLVNEGWACDSPMHF